MHLNYSNDKGKESSEAHILSYRCTSGFVRLRPNWMIDYSINDGRWFAGFLNMIFLPMFRLQLLGF
jgi:hypothetical protein